MRNIGLTLQYDGANFSGFELQPGKRSVRGEIEKALNRLFKEPIKIRSASRTDAGVSALSQSVNFPLKNPIPLSSIPAALNSILPDDIRVIRAEEKDAGFNSRYAAKSKEYEYLIYNGAVLPPFLREMVWHVRPPLDVPAMKAAARLLAGRHDFSSFCAARSDDKDFVKIIYKVSVTRKKIGLWGRGKTELVCCRVAGNGFLYKMVRNMVGTLVEVGLGRLAAPEIKKVLKGHNRKLAGRTAPAQGLCLLSVDY